MTRIRKIGAAAGVLLGATLALAAFAGPASARWYGDGRWHEDDRYVAPDSRYYYGYNYRAPPIIYSTPYNYGYYPPPVYYDNTPGFTIHIGP